MGDRRKCCYCFAFCIRASVGVVTSFFVRASPYTPPSIYPRRTFKCAFFFLFFFLPTTQSTVGVSVESKFISRAFSSDGAKEACRKGHDCLPCKRLQPADVLSRLAKKKKRRYERASVRISQAVLCMGGGRTSLRSEEVNRTIFCFYFIFL